MFAITISPRYRTLDPVRLYDMDMHGIRRYLNQCSHHYILYPEFDSTSRIHYHGVVQIDDIIKWHKIKYKFDGIGFTKVDRFKTFKDHLTYLLYCQKDYAVTGQLLEPVIYKCLKRTRQAKTPELDSGILKWCIIDGDEE